MKLTTRKLVLMALLIAVSIALVYIVRFPIFPAAPYLEYDPADIPILIGAFAFGPVAGIIIAVIACAVQALTVSAAGGIYGFIMHLIATSTLVVVASTIYRVRHTRTGAVIGLASGTIAMAGIMMVANHFVTPFYTGAPTEAIDAMLLPIIMPFNLIKAGANSIITFLVYKVVSKHIIHAEPKTTADKPA